jgi:hypothetical protein
MAYEEYPSKKLQNFAQANVLELDQIGAHNIKILLVYCFEDEIGPSSGYLHVEE